MLLIRETQEQKAEQLESKTSLKSINKYVQHAPVTSWLLSNRQNQSDQVWS